jgi:hypothetical protein
MQVALRWPRCRPLWLQSILHVHWDNPVKTESQGRVPGASPCLTSHLMLESPLLAAFHCLFAMPLGMGCPLPHEVSAQMHSHSPTGLGHSLVLWTHCWGQHGVIGGAHGCGLLTRGRRARRRLERQWWMGTGICLDRRNNVCSMAQLSTMADNN